MGNVAASGGYYISCAADTIVADPTTLTGSIGIYGQFFSGEKLIKDKMGITSSVVKTNEHSDFGGGYPLPLPISNRPLTPYEKNVLQKYIEKGYETFLNRVAQGRHMTRDEVHEIAQGRVWTGRFGRTGRCDTNCCSESKSERLQNRRIPDRKRFHARIAE